MIWKRAGVEIKVPLLEYLGNLIKDVKALGHELQVSVGTDSQRNGRSYKAATVILIRTSEDLGGGTNVGRGGKMIQSEYPLSVYQKGKEGVNERMIAEVGKSIEVATLIAPLLDEHDIKLEIHADINPNPKWESNKALSAAVGWILGSGYGFKIKPEAPAASNCSDKYAK
jgi:predicted RNase H-related nuclease YkuK (DUF458 family)